MKGEEGVNGMKRSQIKLKLLLFDELVSFEAIFFLFSLIKPCYLFSRKSKKHLFLAHLSRRLMVSLYTKYIKKRNRYFFADNLSNFKDVHCKLAGYID